MEMILSFIQVLLSNVLVFILLTLIIGTLTLTERKVLSLVQRRVGPNYMGYKGSFQFIADALKLLSKHIMLMSNVNKMHFMMIPSSMLVVCYSLWMNMMWAPNLAICEVEYNLLFMNLLSIIISLFLLLVGWTTKNKYSVLASSSVLVIILNLEILLGFTTTFLVSMFETFSFFQMTSFQYNWTWGVFMTLPLLPMLLIVFFLETGRIPFDLNEAESELIAGYTLEMSGFFFALFYLGEYFHLFCFSFVYMMLFFGGWHLLDM